MDTNEGFMTKLAEALERAGAPAHTILALLDEFVAVFPTSFVIVILANCIVLKFDDKGYESTIGSEIARCINLSKLADIHDIYESVLHDTMTTQEGMQCLQHVIDSKPQFPPWLSTLMCACASAALAPVAFQSSLIDMPICFSLGGLVGVMQYFITPRFPSFRSATTEVIVAIAMTFTSRAFGSIQALGQSLFCFPALAFSSLALIGPGYTVLRGILEMNGGIYVPGSLRVLMGIFKAMALAGAIAAGSGLYDYIQSEPEWFYSSTLNPY